MAYIEYDTEKINSVMNTYTDCVDRMETLQKSMQDMVDEVRDAWRSDAGNAFFDKYDNEWLKGFTQYMEVLSHMAENLGMASERYSEITDQANTLKIS